MTEVIIQVDKETLSIFRAKSDRLGWNSPEHFASHLLGDLRDSNGLTVTILPFKKKRLFNILKKEEPQK